MTEAFTIRPFRIADEAGWLRCRVLAFLDTPYFDDVRQTKEHYENPSIELVALERDRVVGLIDVEYDTEARAVCWLRNGRGGAIWHLAVHPDVQGKGVGKRLLEDARRIAAHDKVVRFEAWTRGDARACEWYEAMGFQKMHAYLQFYFDHEEADQIVRCTMTDSRVIHGLCHYRGSDWQRIRENFKRVHECRLYEIHF
jgi:ribosomal protein S18 acetylase RimI-like enzyme